MTRMVIVCPQCRVPFTRTTASDKPAVHQGWYYDAEKADWCVECRLGVRWFDRNGEATACR